MKKEIIKSCFRCFFSLVLLYLARNETGPWTNIILFLILCNIELTFWVSKLSKQNTDLLNLIVKKIYYS